MNIIIQPARMNVSVDGKGVSVSTGTPILDRPLYEGETTVTPTEEQQTLETNGCRMESNITVNGIPADYVGSEVPRKTELDLTAIGATVTAPAGYYAEAASKSVQSGSVNIPSTTTVDITNFWASVDDATGNVECRGAGLLRYTPAITSGYIDSTSIEPRRIVATGTGTGATLTTASGATITPTEQEQTAVPTHVWTTGDIKVAAIPSQYYDMSGSLAWLGAGATLVDTFTLADVKLSATDFNTWTPSTTATDILASRTAGTFTASNMPDYDYYVVWETKIPIVYSSGSVNKAKGLYLAAFHVQTLIRRASTYANLQAGIKNSNVNLSSFTAGNFYRYYNATQDNLTYTTNTSYGFYGTVTANTFSSSTADSPTVMLKTPKVTARCSTTYLSTANAGKIDKDKTIISQTCKVYKVKASSFMRGVWDNVMRLVQEVDP